MSNCALLADLTASFLASSTPIQLFGWLLFLVDCGACLLLKQPLGVEQGYVLGIFFSALLMAMPLVYFSLRIKFDEFAFALIGQFNDENTALKQFDLALNQLALRKKLDSRDLIARAKAARSLVSKLTLVVAIQFVLSLFGIYSYHVV